MLLRPLLLALVALLPATVHAADPLRLDWCVPGATTSLGLGVTPKDTCQAVHVKLASKSVRVHAARGGRGLPSDWTVSVSAEREIVASGPSELPAGASISELLIVETDRSTGGQDPRGALPLEWETWTASGAGLVGPAGVAKISTPPVLDLQDAAARGLVLVTLEGLGTAGPVEVTVDNPTWMPLWLDLPAGTVLTADGHDWVVGLAPPFRMMRKQKTGMTVTAFPLKPGAHATTPRKLAWAARRTHEVSARVRGLALATEELERRSDVRERTPGEFERAEPFDFWPLVLRWATWRATGAAQPDLLAGMVSRLLQERAAKGDARAAALDPTLATAEVESAVAELDAIASQFLQEPLELLTARARFN